MIGVGVTLTGLQVTELLGLLLFWILPAVLVANYARSKGYDLILFLVFGLFATWLVAWIVALLVPRRSWA